MRIQAFDFNVNLLASILWQYNEAEHLQALLNYKQVWYNTNQTEFWTNWYNDVFNLQTANEFGLRVWSIILDLPLQNDSENNDKPIFGFSFYDLIVNFTRGNFASNGGLGLDIDELRILLQLRYFRLVTNCSIPEANRFFNFVFKKFPGSAYLLDGNMSITFVYTFPINPTLLNAIRTFDLVPRGAGVKVNYVSGLVDVFGFGENHLNFTRGQFAQPL